MNLGHHTEHGIFEANFEIVADVLPALWTAATPRSARAEHVAETEKLTQNVAEVETAGIEPASGGRLQSLVAEPVVGRALLRIAQNAIGFRGFLEFLLGFLIVGIAVGMMLESELTIRALDLLVVGVTPNAQSS